MDAAYLPMQTGGCHVKYTKEQRLDIGRRIYDGELTRYEIDTAHLCKPGQLHIISVSLECPKGNEDAII